MNNKQKYITFCKNEKKLPIFSQYWWLNSTAGEENWDVILIEKGGKIIASMPYITKKLYRIFNIIGLPKLTQNLGPYLKYPEGQNYSSKLSYEKKIFTELIKKLPNYDYFNQSFHHSITNWLPFYWKGYKQTTNYTYIIDNLENLNNIFKNFSHAKRKNIKKALNIVQIKYDLSAKDFYENHKMTLKKQNSKISYSYNLFKKLYDSGYTNNSAKTIYAIDKDNNIHSALFVVWDNNSTYDLISTINPDFRNSGSASLLIQEIIKFASNNSKMFDFEGSMIENVENSFRQFGAKQVPYFKISKINSRFFKILKHSKNIFK